MKNPCWSIRADIPDDVSGNRINGSFYDTRLENSQSIAESTIDPKVRAVLERHRTHSLGDHY